MLKVKQVGTPPLREGKERKPFGGRAAYTIAAEGLLEFGPDLEKEKQLRSS